MMSLWKFTTNVALINVCVTLQVLQLEAPVYVELGEDLHLKCHFELGGKKLYSIKWFRGSQEIFSYISSQSGPAHYTFVSDSSASVNITSYSVLPNSSCEIVLGSVVMETSGLYTCLVTGGDNPFKEDSNTKTVKVAVGPVSAPTISGVLSSYTPGDFLNLNCSTFNSSISPRLKWVVNHEEVNTFGLERSYPPTYHKYQIEGPGRNETTLVTTVLGLQLWLTEKHFQDGKLLVSCKAFISDIYNRSSNSYTVGRYTEPLQYLETRSRSSSPPAPVYLLLAGLKMFLYISFL